ncbi:hypothetical protein NQ314_005137 [Rhamnusium bicolor]|uniref:Uncharacterized protein n=1 Tax=Rhamnusium bicolor TaxID=1586634 RepID=A0AAV8ZK68_9CUCU|nr:hypothetical protein NQ314_005137 [Rhamnusium bicolor]
MALTQTLCFAVIILLVNVNLTWSLETSHPLHRVQRAILSENPTEEVNSLIDDTLSRSNVQSLLKGILPSPIVNLRRRLANEDLLEEFVGNLKSSLLREGTANDLQSILDVLNSELGGPVLVLLNSSVVVDVDALEGIIINYSQDYIQKEYSDDIFLQIVLKGAVEAEVKEATTRLRPLLADRVVPIELANEVVSLVNESGRSKRDINSLILELLRPQIAAILTPIQVQINTVLDNILIQIFSFYTPNEPEGPIGIITSILFNFTNRAILRVAEIIVIIQTDINAIFANLINGTSISRRRRDVDLEFDDLYDFSKLDLIVSHKRVTRSIDPIQPIIGLIAGLVGTVTSNLNPLIKGVFIKILSSQYENIGRLVTLPLRVIFNELINIILPCSTCASIV